VMTSRAGTTTRLEFTEDAQSGALQPAQML
jgi:hypothetical protein